MKPKPETEILRALGMLGGTYSERALIIQVRILCKSDACPTESELRAVLSTLESEGWIVRANDPDLGTTVMLTATGKARYLKIANS